MYSPGIYKEGIQGSKSDVMGWGQDLILAIRNVKVLQGWREAGRDEEEQKVEIKNPSSSGNNNRNHDLGLQTLKTQTNRRRTSNGSQSDLTGCQAEEHLWQVAVTLIWATDVGHLFWDFSLDYQRGQGTGNFAKHVLHLRYAGSCLYSGNLTEGLA